LPVNSAATFFITPARPRELRRGCAKEEDVVVLDPSGGYFGALLITHTRPLIPATKAFKKSGAFG
jgi:hypothetical protein